MRWASAQPKEELCACARVILGGVNIDTPSGVEGLFYTDDPLDFISHRVSNLHGILGCPDDENGKLCP